MAAEYFLKFSIGLALTWMFYRVFLSQLTFHQCNRVYLLGYTLLNFAIPFMNITPWMNERAVPVTVVNNVPVLEEYLFVNQAQWWWQHWLLLLVGLGIAIGVARLVIQAVSYHKMKKGSVLMHEKESIRIYASGNMTGAFSFGNNIYINPSQHTSEELQRILLHEIVHVKQRHTIDLVVGELICILNWYNPFAWLMRKAIRQNLEYIADDNVMSKGHDRKAYQYLLLKVTGMPGFRIVSHFNITDLKKRIAMMNKIRSAKMHLAKFLFAAPLLALLLVAFRSEKQDKDQLPAINPNETKSLESELFNNPLAIKPVDTLPEPEVQETEEPVQSEAPVKTFVPEKFNKKGYALSVISTNGETLVLIREKNRKEMQVMPISEWNKNRNTNERKYGKLPLPAPPAPPARPAPPAPPAPPAQPAQPDPSAASDQKELREAQAQLARKQASQVKKQAELVAAQQKLVRKQMELQATKITIHPAK